MELGSQAPRDIKGEKVVLSEPSTCTSQAAGGFTPDVNLFERLRCIVLRTQNNRDRAPDAAWASHVAGACAFSAALPVAVKSEH